MSENKTTSLYLHIAPSPYLDDLIKALNRGDGSTADPRIEKALSMLDQCLTLLQTITKTAARISVTVEAEEVRMSVLDDDVAALQQEVTTQTTAIQSAETLLNGIGKLVQDAVDAALAAGATPAQLTAITDVTSTLNANTASLVAAVAANTPAEPDPAPEPAPAA